MHICRFCARVTCVPRARSPFALWLSCSRERMADVAVPCAPDREPLVGAASPRACDCSQPRTC
eukprot:1998396-Pleurochrysis_carterae.AAC.3